MCTDGRTDGRRGKGQTEKHDKMYGIIDLLWFIYKRQRPLSYRVKCRCYLEKNISTEFFKPHDIQNIKRKSERLRRFSFSLFPGQNGTFNFKGRTTKTVIKILTFCWPCISVYLSQYLTNLMHNICFTISFISCLYMFRAQMLIIRKSKVHYTASGIITPIGSRLVHQVG